MKKILAGALMICAMLLSAPAAQAAGFKFGPKVGLNINKFSMDKSALGSDNRCGFTAGVAAQFTVPLIGVGADVSVMYTRRNNEANVPQLDGLNGIKEVFNKKTHYDYISVPVHLMYKLDLPAISSIVAPYVITGPDFSFRVSKEIMNDFYAKKCNVAWDFGLGVELIKHLQISATYSLGMNKAVKYVGMVSSTVGSIDTNSGIKGNTNGWTVSAAWMF